MTYKKSQPNKPRGYFSDDLLGDLIIMGYLKTASIPKLERIRFNINKIIKKQKYGLFGVAKKNKK